MTRPLMRANAQWQMHPQPVLIARVPRHPPQIFSIFRLPLRLHLLHELQLPSVIRHNNKTNKQQQSQKESFIKCGQDRPSQYTQGGLGPPCQPTCLDLPRLSSTVLLLYISTFGSQPTCLDLPRFAYCSISGASVVSPRPSTRLDLRSLSRSGLSVGSPPVVATLPLRSRNSKSSMNDININSMAVR